MRSLMYRRYYYGGEYSDEELPLPDTAIMWEINQVSISYEVKEEKWTKDYVIVAEYSEELYNMFNEMLSSILTMKLGNSLITVITAVYFYGKPPLRNISEVQYLLDGVYLRKVKDDVISMNKKEFKMFDADWFVWVRKYSDITMTLSKALNFTEEGIEAATAYFKTFNTFQDNVMFELEVIPYKCLRDYKINTDLNSAKEYRDRVIEIFNIAL